MPRSISHPYGLFAILRRRPSLKPRIPRDGVMLSRLDTESRLQDLQDQLRRAQVITPGLMSRLVAGACTRIATPSCATKAKRIDRLIELEAWTEAALALVELQLPQWKLRRLVYEEGAWLCSLS